MLWEAPSHEDKVKPLALKKIFADSTVFPEKLKVQMINRGRVDSGKAFSPHYHEDMYEIFILESSATAIVNDKRIELNAHDVLIVEPNEVHVLENNNKETLYFWVVGASHVKGGKTVTLER
jgi:quercetin dioxygenase-like cupin family protein